MPNMNLNGSISCKTWPKSRNEIIINMYYGCELKSYYWINRFAKRLPIKQMHNGWLIGNGFIYFFNQLKSDWQWVRSISRLFYWFLIKLILNPHTIHLIHRLIGFEIGYPFVGNICSRLNGTTLTASSTLESALNQRVCC